MYKLKKKQFLLRNFDLYLNESIEKGDGVFLYTKNKKKYLDSTSGLTGTAILGSNVHKIQKAINKQLKKIPYIDYKYFIDENREKLSKLILSKAKHSLDKVFFVGSSGGEACEAAMKLSFQYHHVKGKKKRWFISRKQSYHGSSSDTLSLGDRPNLKLYNPFYPRFRSKINEHNIYRHKKKYEKEEDYTKRCLIELEDKILKLGPENVSGFVAETIMGGLIGDVPPSKGYWKGVRKICTKYDVHLIIDEVWCGTGTTGKSFCIDWDEITPDSIFLGKTLGAGYAPVSAVVTSSKVGEIIKKKLGAIQISTTHQGHSVGIAASLAVQKIIQNEAFLNSVIRKGEFLRKTLNDELKSHEFFRNVRGRGMRNSLEYSCLNKHLFGCALTDYAKNNLNLILSAKWHRVCFSTAINIKKIDLEKLIEKFLITFNKVSSQWTNKNINNYKYRIYY